MGGTSHDERLDVEADWTRLLVMAVPAIFADAEGLVVGVCDGDDYRIFTGFADHQTGLREPN